MADVLTKNGYKTGSFSIGGSTFALVGEPEQNPGINYISERGVRRFNENPSLKPGMNVTMAELNYPTKSTSGKFGKTWSSIFENAVNQNEVLNNALEGLPALETAFPNTRLGRQLQQVAVAIKGKDALGQDRQFFFVEDAGWDTHRNQRELLNVKYPDMNRCIDAFKNEMIKQGQWNNIVFVMASDFGRTMNANSGLGTDHAWGGNFCNYHLEEIVITVSMLSYL